MSGNAVHAIRSWVVHFTAQPHVAFRTRACTTIAEITHLTAAFFRRRNPGFQRRAGMKAGVAHVQWSKDVFLCELIERHSTNASNNLAERNETDVAIRKASTRRISERFFDQSLYCFVVTGPAFSQIEVRCVA